MIYNITVKSYGMSRLMIIAVILLFGYNHSNILAEEAPAPETVAKSGLEEETEAAKAKPLTLKESLSPYAGPVEKPTENDTLHGKVMAGYQGWFRTPEDGYGMGFTHWSGGMRGTPPRCSVDFWPDLSEFDQDERSPTHYRHRDGRVAEVFSSTNKKTVLRHFRWMKNYGIDGVFVQRFGSCVSNQKNARYRSVCAVLSHCREGANQHGRVYAVMYDVGFGPNSVADIKRDWSRLIKEMKLTTTPAYMRHNGAPVVALWGYGFGHRTFDAKAAEDLFAFFKKPENGSCTIMLGVPNDWASWKDDRMRLLKKYVTVVSPWNVGRYGSPKSAREHFKKYWPQDLEVCKANKMDYYPVVFPGFSWSNLKKGGSRLNKIPRLGGKFLWSQVEEVREYGMDMIYVAMFDEVDEGTAIFKCTNDPPVGRFCTYEGYPSDYYLRICGQARILLRGGKAQLPAVKPDPKEMTYRPMSQLEYYSNPKRFDPKRVRRWKTLFGNLSINLHGGPYSPWAQDLVDSQALKVNCSSWAEILKGKTNNPLLVSVAGGEHFNQGTAKVDAIVDRISSHLKGGGTVLMLSSGRYPLYYPNAGKEAKRFGFRLKLQNGLAPGVVYFDKGLGLPKKEWRMTKRVRSRLMHADLYADAKEYLPLATLKTTDGKYVGDMMAAVRPKGDLGNGTILYVASDMLKYPERADILEAILKQAKRAIFVTPKADNHR